jgi:hypothetical protein
MKKEKEKLSAKDEVIQWMTIAFVFVVCLGLFLKILFF